jgi:thymidylate synthase (FAD)
MSVFEQAGMTVEIQAPIFVAREVFRHRTFSFNELSARYVELPNLSYIPSLERLGNGRQSSKNKQGSVNGLSDFESRYMQGAIELASKAARVQYEELLHLGLSRELARLVIPMNQYTRWRMSGNLRNWLGMLELRLGEGVQLETRDYAVAIGQMVADKFPKTWELFDAKL